MKLDIVYLAWNRLEFTRASFGCLLTNTNWDLVSKLIVYDDGSSDGTAEWVDSALTSFPVYSDLRHTSYRSPPAIMNHYVSGSSADVFAKIDNDIAVPPGWLDAAAGVMRLKQRLQLLGLAAGWTGVRESADGYGYLASSHIGGVGLMRTKAFLTREPVGAAGRFGFTEWQHQHRPRRGWITPDLDVVQLDLIPEDPWQTWASEYVGRGWAREWPPYDSANGDWWSWIPVPQVAAP